MSRYVLYFVYLSIPLGFVVAYGTDVAGAAASRCAFAFAFSFAVVYVSNACAARWPRVLMAFPLATIVYVLGVLEAISFYMTGESFGRAFFYHVRIDVIETGLSAYRHLIPLFLVPVVVMPFLDLRLHPATPPAAAGRLGQRAVVAALLIAVTGSLTENSLRTLWVRYVEVSSVAEASPDEIRAMSQALGVVTSHLGAVEFDAVRSPRSKNLLFLYLESVEQAYLDEERFPGLLPNIQRARGEGLEFTNLTQTPGTEWTIAGMFASQCGVPLMAGGKLNDQQFANDGLGTLICLGDLLNKAGYYQVYMGGADLAFAGKGLFYENHRFDEVLGLRKLYRQVSPAPARSRWGLYDATLFELMLRRIPELAKRDRPFAVTALTLDTHAPAGLPSAGCPRYTPTDNRMLDAVHCTDFLFGAFLSELRRLSVYERTLIMVMSDHLALRNDASDMYPEGRKLLAFALNAGATGKVHRRGAHFDVLPTLLELLEVDTDFVPPLGLSLLDARQPSKQVVYDSPYLHSVLRGLLLGLNSETRLCAGDGIDIVSVERAQIRIDDRIYTLSHNGVPRLPDDEVALMLRLSDQGTVRYTELVEIGEMKRRLKRAPGVPHLLVFPREAFPTGRPLGQPDGELVLYVGRWNSPESAVVGSLDSIADLALPEDACPLSI